MFVFGNQSFGCRFCHEYFSLVVKPTPGRKWVDGQPITVCCLVKSLYTDSPSSVK